jgi:AmmeMemoRadiSam system protein A
MDPFVELARLSIRHFVQFHSAPEEIPAGLASALAEQRAAVFVSLHTRNGELRGCMGTLWPAQETLAREIVQNAISACSRDSRFLPVEERELPELEIGVDVLSEMEPTDRSGLDPRRYGVLVSAEDGRRGVLLPDLEGVDTVEQQIAIACRKAGIDPREALALQRFTVQRHGKKG